MFSTIARATSGVLGRATTLRSLPALGRLGGVRFSHGHEETDEEFDARMTAFFQRKDIDGWDIRRGLQELFSIDGVPEPVTISAAMHAMRRVNDHALAVRFMESLKYKCRGMPDIYPYLIQEVRPTLTELGISTPEELGYDKPELALKNPDDIHG
ncbi:putative Cytochrome c oxidase subunit 5A, mitochondrial [Hypsibius exemplaris]|uniref:Cytochrome c oxidase subunit 5A, mitochondrial n=1 Tax=Hypsibius exemplaris TaxID=2072580 RepID=A0A1W0X5T8_HYPEX|nr:putative Cytochrome c oxidase subunit 5A, mitochondrial [Hypsibius exemplaris]